MVIDFDDQGANKIISDQCQSHDCRDKLDELHYANLNFKVTLFTIPAYITMEMADWFEANKGWVELAVHGFYHTSNYECEKWTYEEMDAYMQRVEGAFGDLFVKGFKAPGWQISDDCYRWLQDNGWWVSDKAYNDNRRPEGLGAYVNREGNDFFVTQGLGNVEIEEECSHHHTWNCVGNGVYEQFDEIMDKVNRATNFKFVSEVIDANL